MTPQLESITLKDFRSISGPVMVPLDAPVVLIHGQNGSGKTSILAGIELALTGDIPALRRVDPEYKRHLVHKSATQARLDLNARGLVTGRSSAVLTVTGQSIVGQPLLSPELAKTYSERCYLPQATLGRLLDIYQNQDTRNSSSPLTLFVKDLLGLDVLESLIEGLHDAGDIRRVRNSVPAYPGVENEISAIERKLRQITSEAERLTAAVDFHFKKLQDAAQPLGIAVERPLTNYNDLRKELEAKSSKSQLMGVARIRRDLLAAAERLATLEASNNVSTRVSLEENDASARERLQEWRQGAGMLLNDAIERLLITFPHLPSPTTVDPEVARSTALRTLEEEIIRYAGLLGRQRAAAARLTELQRDVGQLEGRSRRLDEQIGAHASHAGGLAQALAGLLPYINSEECPVCGRDFNEVSALPLASEVSQRAAALNESAGLLESLLRERTTTVAGLASARREQEHLSASQPTQVVTEGWNAERARLQLIKQRLEGLEATATDGTRLIRAANAAARMISAFRESNDQMSALVETLRSAAAHFKRDFTYPSQPLRGLISQLLEIAESEEAILVSSEQHRDNAIAQAQELQTLASSSLSLTKEKNSAQTSLRRLQEIKQDADQAIDITRNLCKKVLDVRTSIVQRTFNDSLNGLWGNLFTRLAPEENFIPAFVLPERSAGIFEVALETLYRRGQKGGSPQAMLSAGNLNTAALTLFLALHLSLDPKLPWLLIDDPVQSMDELHISQFAALLRTLSKQSGRRIVIAIHERPLYDYLALELSPAFPEDKLITVELGRNASGETICRAKHHIWEEDRAILIA
jgi:DNA repair protein SbcC/Rad50